MSKAVKALLRKELTRRLAGVDSLAVVSLTGVDGLATNQLRRDLLAKDVRVTVVKNSIARQALQEVGLAAAGELIQGPCALVIGGDAERMGIVSIVRELMEQRKTVPALQLKGALMEGEVFGPERVEELSRYPTRPEAIAQDVTLVLSPGSRLAGAILGPGAMLAGLVEAIRDRARGDESEAEPAS